MIKSELVQRISTSNPHLYQRDVENIVNAILNEIVAAMSRGDRVELRGFGAFSVKNRPARTGRNPRTGAHVSVAQKSVPFFKTGKEMRERLNKSAPARRRCKVSSLRLAPLAVARPGHEALAMRKFLAFAVLVPLAIVIVMFAVANREIITVSFDPFDSAHPAFALKLPLFMLIFVLVAVGVVVGGIAAWLRQHKWRMRARRAEAEARDLRARLDAAEPRRNLPAVVEASPPFVVPPAA